MNTKEFKFIVHKVQLRYNNEITSIQIQEIQSKAQSYFSNKAVGISVPFIDYEPQWDKWDKNYSIPIQFGFTDYYIAKDFSEWVSNQPGVKVKVTSEDCTPKE